jgi:hypothetical protein
MTARANHSKSSLPSIFKKTAVNDFLMATMSVIFSGRLDRGLTGAILTLQP